MTGDFPLEEDAFHLGTATNVVNDHETLIGSLSIDDNTDMGHTSTQIPCDEVAWVVIPRK